MGKKQKNMNVSRRDFIKKGAAVGVGATALAGLSTQEAQAQRSWDYEADVVVLGAGATGLPAAIRARDLGASVIVVEANYDVGGHAITSGASTPLGGGSNWQKQNNIEDSPDLVFKDLTDWSVMLANGVADYRYNDPEVQRAFADNCAAAHNFLMANGVVFGAFGHDGGSLGISRLRRSDPQLEGFNIPSPMSPVGARGAALIRPLKARARAKGVRFLLNYHMDSIFRDTPNSGKVFGIEASYSPRIPPGSSTRMESFRSEGNINTTQPTVTVRARKAIVIATGGHSSNANFRRTFDHRLTEEHQCGGLPYSFQDASGELAAMSIGAVLWGTANSFERRRVVMKRNVVGSQYTYTSWGPNSPIFPFSRATGINVGNAGWEHVISVNQVGKRFADETQSELPDGTGFEDINPYVHGSIKNTKIEYNAPQYVHAALAMNEGSVAPEFAPGPVWVIFDEAARMRRNWSVTPPTVDIAAGYFFVADTLEELARRVSGNQYQKVPMPPENLVATVARYNSLVDLGKDEDFEKPGTLYKIQTPPFYAAWGTPICHDSVTGLRINGKCQVIDLHGEVIPGLYSGGESAGGSNQHGIGRTTCQGFISGTNAAAEPV